MSGPSHEKTRVALSSVVAAVVLTGSKVAIGLMTGSLGILSEAAHSALDLVAAFITWLAVRVSGRPADAEHHFGHGKIENLSALFETLLLLITCIWIIYEAVRRLFFKEVHVDSNLWAFAVIIFSIFIDWSRSSALMRVAKKHKSQALEADALHFSTDIWSSLVVLLGLVMVWLGNRWQLPWLAKADPLAALLVAGIVIGISLRLGRRTIDSLLDRAPPELLEKVRAVAMVPGVSRVQRVRLRQAGPETFVDVTLAVPLHTPLASAHRLASEVEAAITVALDGADVMVHVEPEGETAASLPETIHEVAARHGLMPHAIALSKPDQQRSLAMHLEVDEHLSVEEAHRQVSAFETELRGALPQFQSIVTHIEPRYSRHAKQRGASDLTKEEVLKVLLQILTWENTLRLSPHHLQLQTCGAQAEVTFHLACDGKMDIAAAHELTTRLETRLRQRLPQLTRVTIHIEPWNDTQPHY